MEAPLRFELIEVSCFFKLTADQVLGFDWIAGSSQVNLLKELINRELSSYAWLNLYHNFTALLFRRRTNHEMIDYLTQACPKIDLRPRIQPQCKGPVFCRQNEKKVIVSLEMLLY